MGEFSYVFLGNGETDKVTEMTNIIIARDLDNSNYNLYYIIYTEWLDNKR